MFHIYICHVKNKEISSNMHIEIHHICDVIIKKTFVKTSRMDAADC